MNGIDEKRLILYYWDTQADPNRWQDASQTCPTPYLVHYPNDDYLVVRICHLTEFSLGRLPEQVYLPIIVK